MAPRRKRKGQRLKYNLSSNPATSVRRKRVLLGGFILPMLRAARLGQKFLASKGVDGLLGLGNRTRRRNRRRRRRN